MLTDFLLGCSVRGNRVVGGKERVIEEAGRGRGQKEKGGRRGGAEEEARGNKLSIAGPVQSTGK